MKKILVLGASGFIGQTLCSVLSQSHEVYGTYFNNKVRPQDTTMIKYNLSNEHAMTHLLETVEPDYVISSLRGDFGDQLDAHSQLAIYAKKHGIRVFFLSTANIFDALTDKAHIESDEPESLSDYGHFKISCETLLTASLGELVTILRLPMVLGIASPRVESMIMELKIGNSIKAYRDLYLNIHSDMLLAEQIKYFIEEDSQGIFHLGSYDVIKHDEMTTKLIRQLGYTSANMQLDRLQEQPYYLALKSTRDVLPVYLLYNANQVIESLIFDN